MTLKHQIKMKLQMIFTRMSYLLVLHSLLNDTKKAGRVGISSFSLEEVAHQRERMLLKKRMMGSASTVEALITFLRNTR